MAKVFYNKSLNIETPTIILKKRDFTNIGKIIASEIKYKNNLSSANEMSFTVHRFTNDKLNIIWEDINDYNIIYVPELDEYFDIHISLSEESGTYKNISCISLAESELSNVNVYGLEVNTENDWVWSKYDTDIQTLFYKDLSAYTIGSDEYIKAKSTSLLHRVLERATNYEIDYIAPSLKKLITWYQFSISESSIYDALIGDIAEQYKCLFKFEIKSDGTRCVKVYDLCNTCEDCGHRGEFYDKCPECGSTNFYGAYGIDTTIITSKDNLATTSTIESNKDQLKNCFHVSGGDDFVTNTISAINPSGNNDFFYCSPEMLDSMPNSLKNKIQSYDIDSNFCLNKEEFLIDTNILNYYNGVIDVINGMYSTNENGIVKNKFEKITNPIIGYRNVATASYDVIDVEDFLQNSMMPTPDIEGQSIDDALSLITRDNLSPIAVNNPNSQEIIGIIENAVINMAKLQINSALYNIEIDKSRNSLYTPGTVGKWSGGIIITSIEDNKVTRTTPLLEIDFNSDVEKYLRQKIEITLSRNELPIIDITDIDMPESEFLQKIKYYSWESLESAKNAFSSCVEIILTSDIAEMSNLLKEKYEKRMSYLETEQTSRKIQIDNVISLKLQLTEIKYDVADRLNFQKYLGNDLWNVFCSYRREASYKNDNYISDGLSNAELMKKSQELIDEAKKELYKAGNLQFNISSTINNLLAIKEFQPIIDSFECGNWIRVVIDDKIYTLRLLSYEVDYDNIDDISVEFSTVTKIFSGVSDVQSVLDSAQSIANSYSYTTQQVKQTVNASKYVDNWVDEGFSATATKIVNNAYNQDIVIDGTGILCRSYEDVEGIYSPYQTKVIGNGIYVTTDGWQTVKGALGKFIYKDNDVEKVAYGLLAETIVGKFVIGEQLYMKNSSGTLRFDAGGLKVTNNIHTVEINPNNTNRLFRIYNAQGVDLLYADSTGGLSITGEINATSGDIGDFSISGGTITHTNGDYSVTMRGVNANKSYGVFWVTDKSLGYDVYPFRVNGDGSFTATKATITGHIVATSGEFTGTVYANDGEFTGVINARGGTFSDIITCSGTISGGTISGAHIYNNYGVYTTEIKDGQLYSHTLSLKAASDGNSGTLSPAIYLLNENGDKKNSLLLGDGNTVLDKGTFIAPSIQGNDDGYFGDISISSGEIESGSSELFIRNNGYSMVFRNNTSTSDGVLRATSNGKIRLGHDSYRWKEIYLSASPNVESDRNMKNSIEPISDKYLKLFSKLKPVSYKYNENDSDRTHLGFISQDVEDAMNEIGMDSLEFAGFCKRYYSDENGDEKELYSLRYEEFISMITKVVQNQELEIKNLVNEMSILKAKISQ